MELGERLASLASKVQQQKASIQTEEATKNAFVMPFIALVLGYDVFDPQEVVPEFTADVGIKKGEKIDYAIVKDGEVQILIECKTVGAPLSLSHASQLFRYFSTTNARIAVLTNGVQYHFFTDLDRPNRMDEKPFLQLDLADLDPSVFPEVEKMGKEFFDLDSILNAAEELKYVGAIKRALAAQFREPDDDWVRLLVARVYEGSITQRVRDQFGPLIRKASQRFLADHVSGSADDLPDEKSHASGSGGLKMPVPSRTAEQLVQDVRGLTRLSPPRPVVDGAPSGVRRLQEPVDVQGISRREPPAVGVGLHHQRGGYVGEQQRRRDRRPVREPRSHHHDRRRLQQRRLQPRDLVEHQATVHLVRDEAALVRGGEHVDHQLPRSVVTDEPVPLDLRVARRAQRTGEPLVAAHVERHAHVCVSGLPGGGKVGGVVRMDEERDGETTDEAVDRVEPGSDARDVRCGEPACIRRARGRPEGERAHAVGACRSSRSRRSRPAAASSPSCASVTQVRQASASRSPSRSRAAVSA